VNRCNSVALGSVCSKAKPAAITKQVRAWEKPAVTSFTIAITVDIMGVSATLWFGYFVASVTALVADKARAVN
jgi:hypothetical protein